MKWLKLCSLVVIGVVLLLAAAPVFISLNDYVLLVEQQVSARLREPVKISGLRAGGLPFPHVTVDDISIGKAGEITAAHVTITPDLWSLLGPTKVIHSVRIDRLVLTEKALRKVPEWSKIGKSAGASGGPGPVRVRQVQIKSALVKLEKATFGPFDARVALNDDNRLDTATVLTVDGKLRAAIKPDGTHYRIDATARDWVLPVKPTVRFNELQLQGVATAEGARLYPVHGTLYGGTLEADTTLSWIKGVHLKGRASINGVEVRSLLQAMGRPPRMSGKLNAKPVFYANSAKGEQLLQSLHLETRFDVQDGVLQGIDIEKSATSIFRNKNPSARTRFDELSGHLVMERGTRRFSDLRIVAGTLSATGKVTVSPDDELSGRINTSLEAGALASASMPLNVSGTVESPVLLPPAGVAAGAAVGTAILGPAGTAIGTAIGVKLEQLFGGDSSQ